VNNDYLVLEYSTDGDAFTALAQIIGTESNNTPTQYSYEHESPLGELNYYRLKQVDFDGSYSYSDIVVLRKEDAPNKSKVYPNPSSDELVYEGAGATLTIYDFYGKRLKQVEAQVGTQRIDIRDLRPGSYLLEVFMSDETREVRRFIKR
jgi:hypothetical protein